MKCKTLICAAVLGVLSLGGANPVPSQKKDDAPKKAAQGGDLAKLAKARLEAAEKVYKARYMGQGGAVHEARYQDSIRWLNAELDVASKKEERVGAYSAHLQRMKEWHKSNPDDASGPITIATFESFRSEAEYWLARERAADR
jgi:hypothetical protein